MEHLWDCLVVLIKHLHFPFIAGLHVSLKNQEKDAVSNVDNMGDNVPYVFLK